MTNKHLNRREFVKRSGHLTTVGLFTPSFMNFNINNLSQSKRGDSLQTSTEFVSGGGSVTVIESDPVTLRLKPHNQSDGGWSQVWWYFKLDGMIPGEEVVIQLEKGNPPISGISPKANFTYDQVNWGLTNTGKPEIIDGQEFFVYKHVVKNSEVWFAYDLPYTPEIMDTLLFSKASGDKEVDVFELCKTTKSRSVKALHFDGADKGSGKYGIWLQARCHAFESGSSWVLHHLADWLLSNDSKAMALRKEATITVVPIVDIDSVVEGRTGKMQQPYDHNRGWDENPGHWPEVTSIKKSIKKLVKKDRADMFIDFHGPGGESHPYFIVPVSEHLTGEKQRQNRAKFFEVLNAKPLTDELSKTQSMTQICYSARTTEVNKGNSASWVIMNSTDHMVGLTLEVNMNTPLSTMEGYRSEAIVLGQAIADYFVGGHHQK